MSNNNIFLKYDEITKVEEIAERKRSKKKVLKHVSKKKHISDVEETLDKFFPKKQEIDDTGKTKHLHVSRRQATRFDILDLQDQLDATLREQGADDVGICFTRRSLHDQFFDELIRQEVIVSPGRGRLIKMIQDDYRMTLDALWHVCLSTFAYATCTSMLTRRSIVCKRTEMHNFEEKLASLGKNASNILEEFEEKKRMAALEAEILAVKQSFAEELLEKDNALTTQRLLDKADPEHRWLSNH